MGGTCGTNGEMQNAYTILVGKPEGERPLGRPRRGRTDTVRKDFKEKAWNIVDWIHLMQDRDFVLL
jgi:hypothetical protein